MAQYPDLAEFLAAQKNAAQGGPGAAVQGGLEGAITGNQLAFQQKLLGARAALQQAQMNFYNRKTESNYVDADTANKALGKPLFTPGTQVPYQTLDTELRNQAGTAKSAAGAGAKQQATDEKALADLGNTLAANKNSRSPASQAQISLNNIQRAKALVDQVRQQPGGPDTRQTYELALAQVRSLIGAQQISEKEVDALKPSTFKGSALAFLEKVQNEPIGQDQISFLNRLSDTLNREQGVNSDILNQFKAQVVTAHKGLISRNPQDAGDLIAAHGIDPTGFIPNYKPSQMATSLFPKNPVINPSVGGAVPGATAPGQTPSTPLAAAANGSQAPLNDPKALLRAKLGL